MHGLHEELSIREAAQLHALEEEDQKKEGIAECHLVKKRAEYERKNHGSEE